MLGSHLVALFVVAQEAGLRWRKHLTGTHWVWLWDIKGSWSFQLVLSASCLQFKMWAIGFRGRPVCRHAAPSGRGGSCTLSFPCLHNGNALVPLPGATSINQIFLLYTIEYRMMMRTLYSSILKAVRVPCPSYVWSLLLCPSLLLGPTRPSFWSVLATEGSFLFPILLWTLPMGWGSRYYLTPKKQGQFQYQEDWVWIQALMF